MSKNAWRFVFIRFVLLMLCMITLGILVVLPANPICYNKVCSCRYDKDGKVLVMRICYQSVKKLRDGYEKCVAWDETRYIQDYLELAGMH